MDANATVARHYASAELPCAPGRGKTSASACNDLNVASRLEGAEGSAPPLGSASSDSFCSNAGATVPSPQHLVREADGQGAVLLDMQRIVGTADHAGVPVLGRHATDRHASDRKNLTCSMSWYTYAWRCVPLAPVHGGLGHGLDTTSLSAQDSEHNGFTEASGTQNE